MGKVVSLRLAGMAALGGVLAAFLATSGRALAHHEGLIDETVLDRLVHNAMALNVLGVVGLSAIALAFISPYIIYFLYRRSQRMAGADPALPEEAPEDTPGITGG